MPTYQAYGIHIQSDLVLPELVPVLRGGPGRRNVIRVRLAPARKIARSAGTIFLRVNDLQGQVWLQGTRCTNGYLLRFVGLADFFVNHSGDLIECCSIYHSIEMPTVRHLVLDAVLPRVLDLRGIESFHATAVSIDGSACIFIGPTGTGKSTLAASFALTGSPLLADDCVVLKGSRDIFVTPGYPGTRLWKDSFDALTLDSERSAALSGLHSKRRVFQFNRNFGKEPRPVKSIYLLRRPEDPSAVGCAEPSLKKVTRAEAMIQLVGALYRFVPTDPSRHLNKFRFLARLVARVPVKALIIPRNFAALPAVRELVLMDLRGQSAAQ